MQQKILALRMERQHLTVPANEAEYIELYRDLQPGMNVYWNGFGQPPTLSFRAAFDDIEFNRARQADRRLIKGRFAGGNLGWIMPEDVELFAALYRKPLAKPTETHLRILELIEQMGPSNIQRIKEETGLLVKEITPALHRLQQAFLVYEDQTDGQWDRGWMRFSEMFPEADLEKYSRADALKIVLERFARRMAWFTPGMAKAYYKLPEKEIRAAIAAMIADGTLTEAEGGYMLAADEILLREYAPAPPKGVYAIHRNDVLYRAQEDALKRWAQSLCESLLYDHEPLQYLLIDGEFRGASVGHFRNGPYDLNDVICDLPDPEKYRDAMISALRAVNFGHFPKRFMGKEL